MRNFIRNIMKGLRGFIRNEARETAQEPVAGEPPAATPPAGAAPIERFDTAVLTPSGIRFKGIRFHDRAVTAMLLNPLARNGERYPKVVVKYDPSTVASISIWNGSARPHPTWVTVPVAAPDLRKDVSFVQYEHMRRFAKNHDLAFITDDERSKARELLRRHWEKLANQSPVRETPAPRNVDPWDGPFEDELALTADDVVDVEIDPLQTSSEETRPRGRKPSKLAPAKAKRTKARKMAEAKAKVPTRISRIKRK